ncbi:Histidine protein methyltransferase 1 [Rhizoctonia solani]
MFKFDFDVEDESPDETNQGITSDADHDPDERPFQEYSLQDLTLPDDVSYSSVKVRDTHIPRRDLFDVRLQLMASEAQSDNLTGKAKEDQAAIEFASRPSDLVPRVYEGGMKTWECSLDLAAYVLDEHVRGKKVLEDYNSSVLEYVTLPNMILVWFFSKAGESYRATIPPPSPKPDSKSKLPEVSNLTLESVPEEDEEETQVGPESPRASYDPHAFDITEPGDLAFPPALRSAFQDSLSAHHIELRFFSGPWDTFHPETPYDLVLTSETIYQPTSLPSLVRLLRDATCPGGKCLVAAKMVYFGVGGGIREFEAALEKGGSSVKCVWEQREGVGRSIMQVVFGK